MICVPDGKDSHCLHNNNRIGREFYPKTERVMTKKELRSAMKQRNLALPEEARAGASRRIFSHPELLALLRGVHCVALYCALPDEPSTEGALRDWAAAGKRVVVPRVEGDRMRFYDYDPAGMVPGAFGIAEPGPGARLCSPSEIELVVVPGTAFTRPGARMGRGRGYYDRYLSQEGFRAVKAGVCYRHQLVETLPVEPHDIFMDHVYTD